MSNGVIKRTLPNGVRVLCETVPHVRSVALGIWVNTGSRMEEDGEAGVSHLIEHMLFKGTKRRTAEQIAQEIEGRGGHLNAFTDREATCYYARILSDDLAVGVDVLADMLTDSKLDPADLSTEIGVVLEEIKKYEDVPEDHIHDMHAHQSPGGIIHQNPGGSSRATASSRARLRSGNAVALASSAAAAPG